MYELICNIDWNKQALTFLSASLRVLEWRPLKRGAIPTVAYNEKSVLPHLLVQVWRRHYNAELFERALFALR